MKSVEKSIEDCLLMPWGLTDKKSFAYADEEFGGDLSLMSQSFGYKNWEEALKFSVMASVPFEDNFLFKGQSEIGYVPSNVTTETIDFFMETLRQQNRVSNRSELLKLIRKSGSFLAPRSITPNGVFEKENKPMVYFGAVNFCMYHEKSIKLTSLYADSLFAYEDFLAMVYTSLFYSMRSVSSPILLCSKHDDVSVSQYMLNMMPESEASSKLYELEILETLRTMGIGAEKQLDSIHGLKVGALAGAGMCFFVPQMDDDFVVEFTYGYGQTRRVEMSDLQIGLALGAANLVLSAQRHTNEKERGDIAVVAKYLLMACFLERVNCPEIIDLMHWICLSKRSGSNVLEEFLSTEKDFAWNEPILEIKSVKVCKEGSGKQILH